MFSFTTLPQIPAEIRRESSLGSYFSSALIWGVPAGNNSITLEELCYYKLCYYKLIQNAVM